MPLPRLPSSARAALLVVLIFVAYLPALGAGFIWDDIQTYILENPVIQANDGLRRIWTSIQPMDFYPLTFTTWWIEWRVWGRNPAGYHALNVLLHAGSALLVWRLLLRLAVPGAWVAALAWGLHPVNVESVAWISQRKNTLSGLFFFAALLFWMRAETRAEPRGRRGRGALAWAFVFFLCSLLSKAATAMLPFVLLLSTWWHRGRVQRSDLRRGAPFFALALVLGLVNAWYQDRVIGTAVVRDASFAQRLADAGWVVWFYASKAFLPVGLALVYPYRAAPSAAAGVLCGAALVALAAFAWACRATWGRPVLAALAYFVVMLLPVLGFVDIGFMQYALVSDHWQYLALLGPVALAVGVAARVLGGRPIAAGAGAALAVVLGTLTFAQSRIYHDEESAWTDTLRKNPKAWMAHNNMGKVLLARGDLEAADRHLTAALQLHPEDPVACINLASTRARQGRLDEAAALFERAVALGPGYAPAHYNLGHLHVLRGDLDRAERHLREALRLDPRHVQAHYELGTVLGRRGQAETAAQHFEAALALRPTYADAHFNLGLLRLQQGELDAAVRHLQEVVRLAPSDAEARRKLDEALELRRRAGGS